MEVSLQVVEPVEAVRPGRSAKPAKSMAELGSSPSRRIRGEGAGDVGGLPPDPCEPYESREGEGAGSVLGRAYRALTLGIVCTVLLIAFEATAVGTAMPAAADELHGVSVYAFAFSAYFTTSLLGMVGAGLWSDRRGPLPALASGIAAFAAGLVLAGTAAAMWIFVLARAVQGIGGGLVIVALYVTVSRAYPERLRPPVMAAFAAAWVVPSVVGPLVAGTVTQQLGWRWVFLGIPVLIVLPLAVMLPALRRSASGPPEGPEAEGGTGGEGPAPVDWRRLRFAVVLALGAGLLQYAGQGLSLTAVLPGAVGAVLLVVAALRLLPPGMYRAAHGLPAVVLLRGMGAGAWVVAESFVPLMLVTQRGLSVTAAGLALAAGGSTWALGSWTLSRPRLEPYRERFAQLGMVLVTLGVAYAPVVLVRAVPVWTLAVAMAVACYGMGLVIASTSVLLLKLSPRREAGHNSAALQMSDGLSCIVLLAVTGAAFAAFGGGSVNVATAHGSSGGGGASGVGAAASGGQPLAFTAVYAASVAVAAAGVWVAGRLRVRE